MIKDRDTLDQVFKIVKQVKKPFAKIYPNGQIVGTDEQFASFNVLIMENFNLDINIPIVFNVTEFSAFMRELANNPNEKLVFTNYDINLYVPIKRNEYDIISLTNYIEIGFQIDDLLNKVMNIQYDNILCKYENIHENFPDMFSMKVSDGAKMFHIDQFIMTSFNAIHPANKSDRVDLIIRDFDLYSYIAEFIIYKKKDKYQLHEYLRFRKF